MRRIEKHWMRALLLVCVLSGSVSSQIMALEMQEEEIIQQEQVEEIEVEQQEQVEETEAEQQEWVGETEAEQQEWVEETEIIQQEQIETEEIAAQELDFGDYQSHMTVGEKQLLMVTVIPMEATNQKLSYFSADETVAAVNGMGRITANAAGETEIKVTCGTIEESFLLKVTDAVNTEETVKVENIEVADYEDTLETGKTLRLQATVLPADAADSITYVSSDTSVATVNSSGEVKGIAKGTVTIFCKAGAITKEIPLNIIVATDKLSVNQKYLVLQPGEEFSLKAFVSPNEADQHVSYRSVDESVATVSESGKIYAAACGSTCIMVSNEDAVISVSVIVDWKSVQFSEDGAEGKGNIETKAEVPTRISAKDVSVLSEEILKQLYLNKKKITVYGDNYEYQIDGKEIVNYNNIFRTNLEFVREENGLSFIVNGGEELCGAVTLILEDIEGDYLYLYNPSKEKYQFIMDYGEEEMKLTTGGKYLITQKKLNAFYWNPVLITVILGILLVVIIIYVAVKKRYWFW